MPFNCEDINTARHARSCAWLRAATRFGYAEVFDIPAVYGPSSYKPGMAKCAIAWRLPTKT
jgi:hypothetical protein